MDKDGAAFGSPAGEPAVDADALAEVRRLPATLRV